MDRFDGSLRRGPSICGERSERLSLAELRQWGRGLAASRRNIVNLSQLRQTKWMSSAWCLSSTNNKFPPIFVIPAWYLFPLIPADQTADLHIATSITAAAAAAAFLFSFFIFQCWNPVPELSISCLIFQDFSGFLISNFQDFSGFSISNFQDFFGFLLIFQDFSGFSISNFQDFFGFFKIFKDFYWFFRIFQDF